MKDIKILLPGLLLIILSFGVFSQNNNSTQQNNNKGSGGELIHKFFTGGTIGLQFGSYTYINVAPILGYRFNEYLACGVGANYIYYREKYYTDVIQTNIYGGNFFTRVYFLKDLIPSIKDFYLHGEYEALSLETAIFDNPYSPSHTTKRYWIGSVFGGAGIRQELGERVFMTLTVLFNFNITPDNPFDPLVYRVGFEIGL
jgi:hypothetical protein